MTICWFSPAFLKCIWEWPNLMHLLLTPNPNSDSKNGIAFSYSCCPASQCPSLLLFTDSPPHMNASKLLCPTLQIMEVWCRNIQAGPHVKLAHIQFIRLTERQPLCAWVTSRRYASLLGNWWYRRQLSTWSKPFTLFESEQNFTLWTVWCEHLF